MKIFTSLAFTFLMTFIFTGSILAQNNYCLTDQKTHEFVQLNPESIEFQKRIQAQRSSLTTSNKGQATYTIPIVFHVVYEDENGAENVPGSFITAMVEELNNDFQNLSPDLANIVPAFQNSIGNPDIQFRLATKDPQGNCTNGINRIQNATYTNDGSQNFRPAGTPWARDKYLNIWLVKSVGLPGAAAFSFVPETANPTTNPFDGVVSRYTFVNPSNAQFSTTISHEVGHYLDLWHTWGSQTGGVGSGQPGDPANCNDDDQVGDTPNTIGASGCQNPSTCGSLDNAQNHMDYNFCGSYMFTQGQATRMQQSFSLYSFRSNLVSASNLIATGTDDASYQSPACPPTAEFTVSSNKACQGASITFTNRSFHAFADPNNFSYNWTFNGAVPASSTLENPIVTYNSLGFYNVSLNASLPGTGTNTNTKNNLIEITPGSGSYIGPYVEQFSDPIWPFNFDGSLTWALEKPNTSLFQFQRSVNSYYSPPASVYLNNFSFNDFGEFSMTSPKADLTNMQSGSTFLNFQLAHAPKAGEQEILFLDVSTDCGETFVLNKVWTGAFINTAPATNSLFVPSSLNDWDFISHDISAFAGLDNVQFRLRFRANSGNNIWIDDLHISDSDQPLVSGLNIDLFNDFNLYPNPNDGVFTMEFNVDGNEEVNAEIVDMIGKSTPIEFSESILQGWNSATIDTRNYDLKPGIYFLKLESGDQVFSKRLIIQ